ncbi:cell wall-binding repeat-containing protein [Peptacetobacter sp. AB845]|uniref:cell wall-binding repeat-containing protein n=1 Tax=Peptacetobacter sp. AB845 TaxID=3388429 RepID=UPI0039C9479A
MNKRKMTSIALVAAVAISTVQLAYPTNVFAHEQVNETRIENVREVENNTNEVSRSSQKFEVSTEEELRDAIKNAKGTVDNPAVITVIKDIILTNNLIIPENKNIVLQGINEKTSIKLSEDVKLPTELQSSKDYGMVSLEPTEDEYGVNGTFGKSSVIIKNLTIDGNKKARLFYSGVGNDITLENGATLQNGYAYHPEVKPNENKAGHDGGAIRLVKHSNLTVNGAKLINNESTRYGGAIFCYASGANITINDAYIANNKSFWGGGGIASYNGSLNLKGGIITNNIGGDSGGIHVGAGSKTYMSGNVKVYNNSSRLPNSTKGIYDIYVDDKILLNDKFTGIANFIRRGGNNNDISKVGDIWVSGDNYKITQEDASHIDILEENKMLNLDLEKNNLVVCNAVKVTFNSNIGENSEEKIQKVAKNNKGGTSLKTALLKNTFTRDGYIFLGWATKADGDVVYKDGDSISTDEEVTLYAKWQKAVASVNGVNYPDLQSAIKAANEKDTVKLLSDIEVDEWNEIANIKGITIDGQGKKIIVNKKINASEHDSLLKSSGGNKFLNLTIDLSNVESNNHNVGIWLNNNDEVEKVNIIGKKGFTWGFLVDSDCKKLTIKDSSVKDCYHGIYFAEGAYDNNTNILIQNTTFDSCEYASILRPTGIVFKENTVEGSKLNIMNDKTVIQENTFKKDENKSSRVKFYTEGNNKTFKYNKIETSKDGDVGATVEFENGVNEVDLSKNFWGDKEPQTDKIFKGLDKVKVEKMLGYYFKTEEELKDYLDKDENPSIPSVPSVPSTPSKPSKPVYTHKEVIGANRYETAAKVADELGSYDNVVLVNATSTMSDGLAASGLAGKENGAILLTKKDSIPKATMDRIKKVKKVYIIGGENAISQKVANQITAANIKVERIGGKNRVETSELVAEKLGNYSNAFIVNGFKGEADAMSASAIAARYEAPILLTNGKTSTHAKKSGVEYYVVGGTSVVNKSIADKYNAERLAGKDRYATNREVIDEFYSGSDKLYLANGETLVDALTASTIAKNHGIVLVNEKSDKSILKDKNTVQVGGMNFDIDFE